MPRPRKISREHSLDRAITLFWDHGYRATSMDMLTEALGVARLSIYAIFGSKKALFLKALAHYHSTFFARISNHLEREQSTRAGLYTLMSELMAPRDNGLRRGCFATNVALEMADLDPDIKIRVNAFFQDLVDLFTRAIHRGQQAGEIRQDWPAADLAQFLISSFEGVRVLEKTNVELSRWPDATSLALSVLDDRQRTTSARRT